MRFMTAIAITMLLFSGTTAQEETRTWSGYLTDQMCAYRWRGELAESYARRHALSCNFDKECMASGYGIMVDGTYFKLTEQSNPKAITYLESIKKRNRVYVTIRGTLVKDKIEVEEIKTADEPDRS